MSDADLARALDVREGLRALLMANNGVPLDARAGGAARPRGARAPACACASGADAEPRLVPDAGGVDGALARLLAIVATARGAGHLAAPQGLPARLLHVGLLRPLEEPLGALVQHGGLRERREGARLPRAPARARRLAQRPQRLLDRVDLEEVRAAGACRRAGPAVMPILSPRLGQPGVARPRRRRPRSGRASRSGSSCSTRVDAPQQLAAAHDVAAAATAPAPAPAAGRRRSAAPWCRCWWATRCLQPELVDARPPRRRRSRGTGCSPAGPRSASQRP